MMSLSCYEEEGITYDNPQDVVNGYLDAAENLDTARVIVCLPLELRTSEQYEAIKQSFNTMEESNTSWAVTDRNIAISNQTANSADCSINYTLKMTFKNNASVTTNTTNNWSLVKENESWFLGEEAVIIIQ